jgi:recombination associated protein RdgC
MWFRNLHLFRLPAPWPLSMLELEAALARKPFVNCASQDRETQGWLAPLEGETGLIHSVQGQWLIALGMESRLLPASVIKQVAQDKAHDIEAEQGHKLGRKQMQALREAVTQELLPRAFTRRQRLLAWIDPVDGWLVIDTPSSAKADAFVEALHESLDSIPLQFVRTTESPSACMTRWLAQGEISPDFTIDQDCELKAREDEKATVRYVRHQLDGQDVRTHLEAGKTVSRLALTFQDRVSFVLTENLTLKRLQFLDVLKEEASKEAGEDARALMDASFALMTGELRALLPALLDTLGGEARPAAGE